jgi:hypothetical protein
MFGIKSQEEKELQESLKYLREELNEEKQSRARLDNGFDLKVKDMESDHRLALKEKEFELKHFKDEEVKIAKEEVTEMAKKLAVLTKENEMLKSITDVNADIIDVKDLVSKLVEKLPSIDLKSLTINNPEKK